MRVIRPILILVAAAAIAFTLNAAEKSGVSFTSVQFLKTQGVCFLAGVLAATAILLKGKAKKE